MAAPVKNTCPDIDRAIRHIKDAIDYAKDYVEDKKEFSNIEWELEKAIDYFEDLREANEKLRTWGECLDSELQEAGEEISRLEIKLNVPES